jgi:hypothetical protein
MELLMWPTYLQANTNVHDDGDLLSSSLSLSRALAGS